MKATVKSCATPSDLASVARDNSASLEKLLASQFVVDAGEESLIDTRTQEECVPVLGCYELPEK